MLINTVRLRKTSASRMLFFKYQRPDNLAFSMLRNGEIYFASVDELNDASECRPRFVFRGSEELWQRLAHYILFEACLSSDYFRPDRMDAISGILNISNRVGTSLKKAAGNKDIGIEKLNSLFIAALEEHLADEKQDFSRGFVTHLVRNYIQAVLPRAVKEDKFIASFSLNATNPTMWGHYSAAERGFLVVYDSPDESIHVHSPINLLHGSRPSKNMEGCTEIGTYRDEHLGLEQVDYGRRPPKVNAFHRLIHKFSYSEEEDHYDVPLLIAGDAAEKKEALVGLVKYSDWRYEKEVRAFFPAYNSVLPDGRVLQVDLANMLGVVFGPRMSNEDKARAVLCCHLLVESRDQGAVDRKEMMFFQARQTIDRFDFDILPVGALDKHYLSGHLPVKPVSKLDPEDVKRFQSVARSIAESGSKRPAGNQKGEQGGGGQPATRSESI